MSYLIKSTLTLSLVFQPLTLPCNARTDSLLFPDAIMISLNLIKNLRSNYIFLTSDNVIAIFRPELLQQGCLREQKIVKIFDDIIQLFITRKKKRSHIELLKPGISFFNISHVHLQVSHYIHPWVGIRFYWNFHPR